MRELNTDIQLAVITYIKPCDIYQLFFLSDEQVAIDKHIINCILNDPLKLRYIRRLAVTVQNNIRDTFLHRMYPHLR